MVDQAMGLIQWSMNIIGSDGKACLMVLGHTPVDGSEILHPLRCKKHCK